MLLVVLPVASGWAAVAAPAVLSVPMSTVSASSHLSAVRMHPPSQTDVRRKVAEQLRHTPGKEGKTPYVVRDVSRVQHRIRPLWPAGFTDSWYTRIAAASGRS
ncbi:hypothetical protein GCM10009549_40610 [Streptomyces thermoalcalitolerans]|uniref:Secreted protein n=1 Tax=Streptomyces thermoalcalitolerans TaxID=65605 RepID=A0ABN1P278_9ACTN